MIDLIFVKTHELASFAKVLLDNSNDRFLHFFLQNMVLSTGVDIIEEFFAATFVLVFGFSVCFSGGLSLCEVILETGIVLTSQRFDCNSDLLAEIVG